MIPELIHLQWITLGSIGVLVVLCGLLLLVVWLALNLSQLLERVRATLLRRDERREVRDESQTAPLSPPISGPALSSPVSSRFRFRPGQVVKVIHELDWIGGSGVCVPVGALITLRESFDCFDGRRWTALWKRTHLHSVPEDMIQAITRLECLEESHAKPELYDPTRSEREWIAEQQAAHEQHSSPSTSTG